MRGFGKALQIIALVALPLGMLLQLANAISLGQMLMLLVAGASMFWIGRITEGYAR